MNDLKSISEPIRIPTHSPLYGEVKTIGIWMSGGTDSSLLAYRLAEQLEDHDMGDIKLQPFCVRRTRPYNPFHAEAVLEWIRSQGFPNINEMITYYPDLDDPHQCDIKEFQDRDVDNFTNGVIQIMYSGISHNPPLDVIKSTPGWYETKSGKIQHTETNRDMLPKDIETWGHKPEHGHYINPWSIWTKKEIADDYKERQIMDLFPLTRSCESDKHPTEHCGKCWWCHERKWAFGYV